MHKSCKPDIQKDTCPNWAKKHQANQQKMHPHIEAVFNYRLTTLKHLWPKNQQLQLKTILYNT